MPTIRYPICPNCSSRLRTGWPSFGPEQVKCGYCGSLINTQLTGWNEGPFITSPVLLRKAGLVLTELLAPTCTGYKELGMRLIMGLALSAFTFCLPIFQVLRLRKMIKESLQYEKKKTPPEWKWIYHKVEERGQGVRSQKVKH